jgi:hypothetical protein
MKKKVFKELPLILDRSYKTKFQTGDTFLVKKISTDKNGKVTGLWGIYENKPELGLCPLDSNRLVHEVEFEKVIDVCDHCGEEPFAPKSKD